MFKWLSKLKSRSIEVEQENVQAEPEKVVEIVTTDNLVMEYFWKYNKDTLSVDELYDIFSKMLTKEGVNYTHGIKIKLVEELARSILYSQKEICNSNLKRLLAAVYLVCDRFKIPFYLIVSEAILNPSIRAKDNGIEDEIIPCNFDSFIEIINLKDKYAFNEDDLVDEISEIWIEYFEYLMSFVDERSMALLCLSWIDVAREYFDFEKYLEEEYLDIVTCPNIETANLFVRYFGNETRTITIYEWALYGVLTRIDNSEDYSLAKNVLGFELITILQQMADYTKYRSMEFDMNILWQNMLFTIMYKLDGTVLNEVCDILKQHFNVPKSEIESYIASITFDMLNKFEPVTKLSRMYKLLSNPTVFKAIAIAENSIIQQFE